MDAKVLFGMVISTNARSKKIMEKVFLYKYSFYSVATKTNYSSEGI
jgi:hypothetical protein